MWAWTEVKNSSNINRFGFKGETLKVQFKHGKKGALYQFNQVSPETHQAFKDAESSGKFFSKHVQGAYKSEKIDTPDPKEKGSCEGCRMLAEFSEVDPPICLFLDDAQLTYREDGTAISLCSENWVDGGVIKDASTKPDDGTMQKLDIKRASGA